MEAVSFDLSAQSKGWSFTPARKTQSAFPAQGGVALHNTAKTFAADIARRISGVAMPAASDKEPTAAQSSPPVEKSVYGITHGDLKALETALSGFIDNLMDKFGVKAGNIAQALIYKKVGDKDITEDNLGDGLLDALKFIDQQFGPQAGDELISFMNNGVNKELNAFFNNGKNEEFLVSSGPSDAVAAKVAASGEALAKLARKDEDDSPGGAPSLLDILKRLSKEMEERLRKQMEKSSPDPLDPEISAQTAAQLDAYAAQSDPAALPPGMLVTQAV